MLAVAALHICSLAQDHFLNTAITSHNALGPKRAPRRADSHAAKDKHSPPPRAGGRRRAAADDRCGGRKTTTTTAAGADPERGRRGCGRRRASAAMVVGDGTSTAARARRWRVLVLGRMAVSAARRAQGIQRIRGKLFLSLFRK